MKQSWAGEVDDAADSPVFLIKALVLILLSLVGVPRLYFLL